MLMSLSDKCCAHSVSVVHTVLLHILIPHVPVWAIRGADGTAGGNGWRRMASEYAELVIFSAAQSHVH